jgi:predicted 3-demethylubiquinone-9 3-methyltransferase (glyoxalase superfamily)
MTIKAIIPFLWFNSEAEDAAKFYVSLFPDSKINSLSRYGEGGPGPQGGVMVVDFQIAGMRLTAMNGGPHFKLDEAFSLLVNCEDQAEIDRLWAALGEGGSFSMCGWLKDRFGLSWQINYAQMDRLMTGPAAAKVMAAMITMSKIDIGKLKETAG